MASLAKDVHVPLGSPRKSTIFSRTEKTRRGGSTSRVPCTIEEHFLPVTSASRFEITRRNCLGIDRSLIIAAASFSTTIFSVTQSSRPTAASRQATNDFQWQSFNGETARIVPGRSRSPFSQFSGRDNAGCPFNGSLILAKLWRSSFSLRCLTNGRRREWNCFNTLEHWFLTGVPRNYESRIFFYCYYHDSGGIL